MTGKKTLLEELYARERERLLRISVHGGECEYKHPVFGDGDPDAGIMMIGEAPGREETETGIPFTGKAGRQLDMMLTAACLERGRLFVTNTVKYRPYALSPGGKRNRTPTKKEIIDGLALLSDEIRMIAPDWIVTLGNTPLNAVLMIAGKERELIGDVHGVPLDVQIDRRNVRLFPMYHPASAIYNRSLSDTLEEDMKRFGSMIRLNEAEAGKQEPER